MTEETNVQDEPAPEVTQEKSLDELLAEFKEPEPAPQSSAEQPSVSADDLADVVSWARESRAKEAENEVNSDIDRAVETIISDDDVKTADKDLVEGFLHRAAYRNEHFRKAFENRHKNPEAWNASVKWATNEIRNKLKDSPDAQITSDIEAAAASARGISTNTPDTPDLPNFNEMNDAQFEAWKAKHG